MRLLLKHLFKREKSLTVKEHFPGPGKYKIIPVIDHMKKRIQRYIYNDDKQVKSKYVSSVQRIQEHIDEIRDPELRKELSDAMLDINVTLAEMLTLLDLYKTHCDKSPQLDKINKMFDELRSRYDR